MDELEAHFRAILQAIGENVEREGLRDTPKRAARAWKFLTQGYQQDYHHIINDAIFQSENEEIILLKNIELYSLCEHHLLPFIGKCHIAYIPAGKILGLSKLARIVNLYARRLQIQERLTRQIAECISEVLQPAGVAVVIEAKHLCMMTRGVEKQNSVMSTAVMLGQFKDDMGARANLLDLLKMQHT